MQHMVESLFYPSVTVNTHQHAIASHMQLLLGHVLVT